MVIKSSRNIATVLVLVPLLAMAEESLQLRPGMTGVADLGAIDCATFNDMYPNGPTGMRQAVLYYAEGYIFARTNQGIDALLAKQSDAADWDFDSLTDIIVDHCAANPEVRVGDAVTLLWERLAL